MEERWYLAALMQCHNIGSVRMCRLRTRVSSPEEIWSMNAAALQNIGGLSSLLAEKLAHHTHEHPDLPQQLEEQCEKRGICLVTIDEELYPIILKEIFDPPIVLYYRGMLLADARRVGIVGARKFTPYGEAAAMEFGDKLAAAGVTVVSGAARGIDSCAHRGALRAGRTAAVRLPLKS